MTARSPLDGWPGVTAPCVLLALDYDGTLVPIVDEPRDAEPDPALAALLDGLLADPGVAVAVLSGRDLETLSRWLPDPRLTLVGTHGAEWRDPDGRAVPLLASTEAVAHAARAADTVEAALAGFRGTTVERKRFGVAAHYRRVAAPDRPAWLEAAAEAAGAHVPPFTRHQGKCVLELRWPGVDKGSALGAIRRVRAWEDRPVLALGDDRTDEATFVALGPEDLSVHVGLGATRARRRVNDTDAARRLLAELVDRRRVQAREGSP